MAKESIARGRANCREPTLVVPRRSGAAGRLVAANDSRGAPVVTGERVTSLGKVNCVAGEVGAQVGVVGGNHGMPGIDGVAGAVVPREGGGVRRPVADGVGREVGVDADVRSACARGCVGPGVEAGADGRAVAAGRGCVGPGVDAGRAVTADLGWVGPSSFEARGVVAALVEGALLPVVDVARDESAG